MSEGFKVYGSISNTKIRFLVATKDPIVREEDVKTVCFCSDQTFFSSCFFFRFPSVPLNLIVFHSVCSDADSYKSP